MQVGLVVKSAVTELVIGPMRDDGAHMRVSFAICVTLLVRADDVHIDDRCCFEELGDVGRNAAGIICHRFEVSICLASLAFEPIETEQDKQDHPVPRVSMAKKKAAPEPAARVGTINQRGIIAEITYIRYPIGLCSSSAVGMSPTASSAVSSEMGTFGPAEAAFDRVTESRCSCETIIVLQIRYLLNRYSY